MCLRGESEHQPVCERRFERLALFHSARHCSLATRRRRRRLNLPRCRGASRHHQERRNELPLTTRDRSGQVRWR